MIFKTIVRLNENKLRLTPFLNNLYRDNTTRKTPEGFPSTILAQKINGKFFLHAPISKDGIPVIPSGIGQGILWVSQSTTTTNQTIISELPEGRFCSDSYHKRERLFWLIEIKMSEIENGYLKAEIYVETANMTATTKIMRQLLQGRFDIEKANRNLNFALNRKRKTKRHKKPKRRAHLRLVQFTETITIHDKNIIHRIEEGFYRYLNLEAEIRLNANTNGTFLLVTYTTISKKLALHFLHALRNLELAPRELLEREELIARG